MATAAPLYTNEDRVTLQERRKLADQEMVRRTFNLAEWQGYFDEKNSYWERAAEWRRGSDRPEARAYHERIKSQLRGKR